MAKMRVSQHSGRAGSAAHNDRSFLRGKDAQERREVAPHIRDDAALRNVAWSWARFGGDFREDEMRFYRERYGEAVEATNARYRAQGHPERCRTVEQLYTNKQSRPEEMILQIGNKDAGADPREFEKCVRDYLRRLEEWNRQHGGHMHVLDWAIHYDETSPHCHVRRVWDYQDKDGIIRLGQNKALKAAGLELPHPEKAEGRYNNRKITFDAMARGMWQEIAQQHGFQIETEPRPDMRHKDKAEFIYNQMADKISALEKQLLETQVQAGQQELTLRELQDDVRAKDKQIASLQGQIEHARQQKLDALRERDAARGDRDVVKALSGLQNAVLRHPAPKVDILSEKPARRTFWGKEMPSTVTISREDFNRQQEQAAVNESVKDSAREITRSYKGMKAAAAEINKNRLDSFDVTRDKKTAQLSERVDDLERLADNLGRQLTDEKKKSAALSKELWEEHAAGHEFRQLQRMFPEEFERMRQERHRRKSHNQDISL